MTTSGNPIANPMAVLREEFDNWAVLFNPDEAKAVGINPVGVAIWKIMDGRHDLDQVVADLRQGFDGVPDGVCDDVGTFVADLVQRGFVGYDGQATAP